jgi:hypothetical protein
MAVPTSYLIASQKTKDVLKAIQNAQAPKRFTFNFLESLGFKSTNDRLIIPVFKSLGLLNASGEPTTRYFAFLDAAQGPRVLAEGIREAYADLFQVNRKANDLPQADIKNKLKTLTQGKPSDSVLNNMARTFRALSQSADFSEVPRSEVPEKEESLDVPPPPELLKLEKLQTPLPSLGGLVYNIQLVLPDSRDQAVYDAFFKSLKEHLLR